MSISARIEQLSIPMVEGEAATHFGCEYGDESTAKLNTALKTANNRERFGLVVDLLKLWSDGSKGWMTCFEGKAEEAAAVFGEVFNKHSSQPILLTLTADGKQLRVWYGLPNRMKDTFVDSMGKNLLLNVFGDPEIIKQYLAAFREIYSHHKEIMVPNGVRLFMCWGYGDSYF